jgi:alpha-amylase/alpha-mannosidase (GH57 family)
MPRIYLCFLWHMHQPFYKDLMSGEYRMPWTRLHALKDYYGMVEVLRDFPEVRQTFNLVPSMMLQVEEYAAGKAADPSLRLALKPAETLTEAEQEFILRNFLYANPSRMVTRFPRYAEFCEAWRAAGRNPQRAIRLFTPAALRDLQVLSQLAWFDEEFLAKDPDIHDLVRRGRDYTLDDQMLIARKQAEILGRVIPVYQEFAAAGQIEISTTPFYHPILPLVCDSNIAEVSHPYVPLPPRFRYPQDARTQLERARAFCAERFGGAPAGLWPSEGSVSDEALGIAAESGFSWAATDNGVLSRTLGHTAGIEETYRPYVWRHGGREIAMVFRDHYLSDLIGFVYSRIGWAEAARDFLDRIRENCRGILASGRDALVPIILDGENAWEYYEQNGRPFLRELYRGIAADRQIEALTMSEALKRVEPRPLDRIFPGSWIGANFDVWIGAEEDNRAWEYLLRARQTYDRVVSGSGSGIPDAARALAFEELLIAEGSDWCWWYGPEHQSEVDSPGGVVTPDPEGCRARDPDPAHGPDPAGDRRRDHFLLRVARRRRLSRRPALRRHAREALSDPGTLVWQRRPEPLRAGGFRTRGRGRAGWNGRAPDGRAGRRRVAGELHCATVDKRARGAARGPVRGYARRVPAPVRVSQGARSADVACVTRGRVRGVAAVSVVAMERRPAGRCGSAGGLARSLDCGTDRLAVVGAARTFPARRRLRYTPPLPVCRGEYLSRVAMNCWAAGGTRTLPWMMSRFVRRRPYSAWLSSISSRNVEPWSETPANTPRERDHERISAVRYASVLAAAVRPTGPAATDASPPSVNWLESSRSSPRGFMTSATTSVSDAPIWNPKLPPSARTEAGAVHPTPPCLRQEK